MATLRDYINKANFLRKNGNALEGEKIYNFLLEQFPDNDEILFNYGLCIVGREPLKAIEFFKKAAIKNLRIVNMIGHNIRCVPEHSRTDDVYTGALNALTELLTLYPEQLDLLYHRGVLKGNAGDNLNALSDFFKVINDERTNLKNDRESFLKHQISKDIHNAKIPVRFNTLNASLPSFPKDCVIEEYCYYLPDNQLMPQQNYYIDFGRHIGKTIFETMKNEIGYIDWCILNIDKFCVSEVVYHDMHGSGYEKHNSYIVNTMKLKKWNEQTKQFGNIDNIDSSKYDILIDGDKLQILPKK